MAVKTLASARALGRVPLFARCSRRELAEIARIAGERQFRAGEELTREGEPGEFFYVLLEGAVDVYRGEEKIATMGQGDFIGEIALVGHSARTATVRTASPVRALVIHERAFRSLIGRQPDVQVKVLDALGERL